MMSTRFVHNNTHVGFLLIVFSRIKYIQLLGLNHYAYVTQSRKLVLCMSYKMKYLQNEKRTKICQRSYSTVFNDLSNQTKKLPRQFSNHMPFKCFISKLFDQQCSNILNDHTRVGFEATGRIVAFFAAVPENSRSKTV